MINVSAVYLKPAEHIEALGPLSVFVFIKLAFTIPFRILYQPLSVAIEQYGDRETNNLISSSTIDAQYVKWLIPIMNI